jgi:hypothetical protein
MNPEHKILAQQECAQLQAQGLIEHTDSQWSCEAFYVNKRSEQKQGKLQLFINYQPLNHFLQDDKFLLSNTMTLFSCLHNAKVFSSNLPPLDQNFPTDDLPPLAQEMVLNHTLDLQAKDKLFSLQDYLLLNYDMSAFVFKA